MPAIKLARVAGFCFGVQRAVDLVTQARREIDGKMTTLGMLVHNPQVIARMEQSGVHSAAELESVHEGTVVLSAHGVSPGTLAEARARGLNVVDVTCPFVTRVHRCAQQLVEQGFQLILIGDPGHTEVKGILGAVSGRAILVQGPEQVRSLKLSRRVGIVSQTTQSAETFAAVVAEVSRIAFEVRAYNTICNATDELQEAAVELARQVDLMIVVGGKKSANTGRLRDLCAAQGVPAYHVETAAEIEDSWLKEVETVGVTAGASTPDWLIEEVIQRLNGGSLPEGMQIRHPDERTRAKFFG
jgi:4-hydroxy-3-methylbut-2-enyl diphosphate reductase